MAKLLQIKHPVIPLEEETYLSARYSSGTVWTVKSNEGWNTNDIVVVGNPGEEATEQVILSTLSGDTVINSTAAGKNTHSIDTPLFKSRYNQISVERKPSGGSFAEITEGKVNIEWDERDGNTKVRVSAGSDSDTYKWRFYNSASGEYSAYSGELPGTGLTQFHAGYLVDAVRYFGKIPASSGVRDIDILKSLNRGQRQVDTMHDRWWFALTEDDSSSRVQAVADTYKYGLTSNFRGMDVLQVLDTNDQRYNLSYIPLVEYDSYKVNNVNTSDRSDSTRFWTLLPPDSSNSIGYFGVHPTPDTTDNYYYRRYWRFLPELTSFSSLTLIPLPEILINWGLFEIYKLREDRDNAAFYLSLYQQNIDMLKRIQRRQIGQAEIARYRGPRGYSKLFGEFSVSDIETQRTNFW